MIIEALMAIAIVTHWSWWNLFIVVGLIALRRAPWFANAIALRFELSEAIGMTAWAARMLLPGWDGARVMSRAVGEGEERSAPMPIHVPVQGIAVVSAKPPSDRNIIIDAWIVALADARDEKGGDLFSANAIFKAVGGHRAAVLARVKERRSGVPPAQFRQDDGATAPADYPVTRSA